LRTTDGWRWPRKWTTTIAGAIIEEWRFGRLRVNPKLNDKDFAPRVRHDD
jgi:hypothetical protein